MIGVKFWTFPELIAIRNAEQSKYERFGAFRKTMAKYESMHVIMSSVPKRESYVWYLAVFICRGPHLGILS